MGLLDDVKEIFGADTLYEVLGVKKSVRSDLLKKAYRQKSLLCHPDKANEENKEEFTKKFQILCKCYEILCDEEKRKIYDETGSVDDDSFDEKKDWKSFWRTLFPTVTDSQIQDFFDKYHGSEQEREDLKRAYEKTKGDMNKIAECFIGYDVDDEDRLCSLLQKMIDDEEIPEYRAFTKETASSKAKRQKKFAREAKEAEKVKNEMSSLELILKRRAPEGDDFLAALEAKYSKPKKKLARSKK
ncbi:dnaJ homolog subfamily C member 9-like [Varroa jacobsoni]|uniref:J domain-containing protein n=1 Tax=Varroa destructor TaxID=109461 RepID=A0A7M7J9T4_VARDE|nr:dnaJ homolog subfamily C member 9-like [Varroa destructor]XP_022705050.1 dnaJ homolog subfamily C member 9-like [Varroa jacobsoni]